VKAKGSLAGASGSDRTLNRIAALIEGWFERNARDLPWRAVDRRLGRRDAYRSLVSEAMLQQTPVGRVLTKYGEFLRRFPTVRLLASAREQAVLAAWSGLGYYRRARHLHRAARAIVREHGGRVPSEAGALRRLPGVGRYTAGAIASIVFGAREPIVDGNVRRVLLRVEGKALKGAEAERWAWGRAGELVGASAKPGVLNEGLMELGGTVCTPARARCGECPLATVCASRGAVGGGRASGAWAAGAKAARRQVYVTSLLVRDVRGRVLVERRPERGLWAGMWQAPSVEREDRPARRSELPRGFSVRRAGPVLRFEQALTHRLVRFEVWMATVVGGRVSPRRWIAREEVGRLGISNAQRRILLMEADDGTAARPGKGVPRGGA
jgi:A/G-specific adenine glycosylase